MYRFLFILSLSVCTISVSAQRNLSLKECLDLAKLHNKDLQKMKQSFQTRTYQLQASKLRKLPDLDVLGGYTYQSDPVKINLQSVREGIVKGTAQQNVDAANRVYQEITGNELSQSAQDAIYGGAQEIINGIYPDFNPELSKQQYFTAGLALKVPIYLGGKLQAAQKLAKERVQSGKLNIDFTENTVALSVISQYLKILYLNAMMEKQNQLLHLYEETKADAHSLVKSEIIPPYQGHWANVALTQAEVGYNKLKLERENALLFLKHLLGVDSSQSIQVNKGIGLVADPTLQLSGNFWEQNPGYQWLKSKTKVAEVTEQVTKSASLPNVFGVANYQFLRKDLPLITPPWMVGIGVQWNIFSSLENAKKIKAAESFVKESQLLAEQKKEGLRNKEKIARNKLASLRQQVKSLDLARKEAAHTTEMVRKRMKNEMSSVKNVNDALKVQLETEKAYFSTVLAYDLAVAVYLNIQGDPGRIVDYLQAN